MRKKYRSPAATSAYRRALCAIGLIIAIAAPRADGEEAITINKENVARYKELLPDPIYRRTELGEYVLRMVEVDAKRFRANYTDRFWKASEANAGKYDIDAATGGLKEVQSGKIPPRMFGMPFPKIDAKDPHAGVKIIHNYRVRSWQADGNIHYFDLTDVTQNGELIRRVKIFLAHKYYVGTTSDPPAELPDNTETRQLAAAVEPKDVEGVGVLTWRFHDWTTWDKVWAYLPNVRRVRQVRSATRGDRVPGFEVYGDDSDCYDGKVTYFTWKLVREAEVIGPLGSNTPYAYELKAESPTRWSMDLPYNNAVYETPGANGAGWWTLGNVFIKRPVWIVEGTPKDPYYPVGKIVLYVDRELYHAYYKLGFTPGGEHYQTNLCGQAWGRTPDGKFAAPTALLMTGINEKENRGTPTGRYTRETFDRGFTDAWFSAEQLSKFSTPE